MGQAVWVKGGYNECALKGFTAVWNREIDLILAFSEIKAQASWGDFCNMLCRHSQEKACVSL